MPASIADTDVARSIQAAFPATSPQVSLRMSRVKTGDTAPELRLRSILHGRGLRYRIHRQPCPSVRCRADLVFQMARVAVFVDGCFWHGCPEHASWPKSNAEWWRTKIDKTRRRDETTTRSLTAAGWLVLRVWEHEPADRAADHIEGVVRNRSRRTTAAKQPSVILRSKAPAR